MSWISGDLRGETSLGGAGLGPARAEASAQSAEVAKEGARGGTMGSPTLKRIVRIGA